MRLGIPIWLRDALTLLEAWDLFEEGIKSSRSPKELEASLEAVKAAAKANWKRLAREAHPDLGGDLERMQSLNAAWDAVREAGVSVPEPPPQPMRRPTGGFVQVRVYSGNGFTVTTTTTSAGGFW
jgi:hypothetical protein